MRARRHGAAEQRVAILDVDPERGRRAANRARAFPAPHRVVQHDERIADADFRVHDFPIGPDHTRHFLRTKGLLVPIDGLRRVVEDEMRGDGAETLRNRTLRFGHAFLLRRIPHSPTEKPSRGVQLDAPRPGQCQAVPVRSGDLPPLALVEQRGERSTLARPGNL